VIGRKGHEPFSVLTESMQFGARTHSPREVELLAEAGFEFAEIDWKDAAEARRSIPDLARLRASHGIRYLAHGPNEVDPFDADALDRVTRPAVLELVDLAPELGISLHTQHLWLDPRFVGADTLARKLELLSVWTERAVRVGVTLCIENLSEHAEHLEPAFEAVPDLRMTLDLGHAEILSSPNASHAIIARFPEKIRHVHLHDNRGGRTVKDDQHLPIGAGKIDFATILGELRRSGYDDGLSFELKPEHLEQGREAIRKIWTAPAPRAAR
jgi:sugar phosphate isomerase/epimerase